MSEDAKLKLVLQTERARTVLSSGSAFRLLAEHGLMSTDVKLNIKERGMADGADVCGCHVGAREISLLFEVDPAVMDEEKRRILMGRFLPGEEGMLTVDRGLGARRIGYRMGGAELIQATLYDPLRLQLKLVCTEPWFSDASERVIRLWNSEPLLTFPLLSYRGGGMTAGYRTRTAFLYIDNGGDLPMGVDASFRVLEGVVVNPFLHFGGSRVTLAGEVKEGDVYEIGTCAGDKYVRVNGANALFMRQSSFFSLDVGRCLLVAGAQEGFAQVDGEIRYRQRYLGA